uniref:Uncharacterized protein n=1 Tax=Apteryx owenii TaxID=8824 RepID=A0A8B9SAR7_APTOW
IKKRTQEPSHVGSQRAKGRQTQVLTDIKGSFQSLDISCNPRDTVDAHFLHSTPLYFLHALAHNPPKGGGSVRASTQHTLCRPRSGEALRNGCSALI